jgi:DNA-binding NarL/FixJ family response regulator
MTTRRKSEPRGGARRRIFIVDDHPMVRERLAALIDQQKDLVVCGEAEDAAQGLQKILAAKPDLAIIDLSLKGASGLELIKDLRIRAPDLLMLVLSMHDETLFAERVLRAGARGYITKQEATHRVIEAIRRVLDGAIFLSDQMSAALLGRVIGSAGVSGTPLQLLTDRELEVLQLMGRNRATREIAKELSIDVSTVETHQARIKEKLKIPNAIQLRHFATRWVESGCAT